MSTLRFDGAGAGLRRQLGGDNNSAYDYTVICQCKTELGPLGKFTQNEGGERSIYCPACKHLTVFNKDGQVLRCAEFDLLSHLKKKSP